jgi:Ca2+-binding EF-hand superfamily protein
VSTGDFANFLKQKIDKKRTLPELRQYAHYMDVDKDGFVSEVDLQTCLDNLATSTTFFRNGGEALAQSAFASAKKFYPSADGSGGKDSKLSMERALEVAGQIRQALIDKRMAFREVFNRFDANKDGFLSLAELSNGLDTVLTLSVPIKEKLFALMDKNEIGLVDYANFLRVIKLTTAN